MKTNNTNSKKIVAEFYLKTNKKIKMKENRKILGNTFLFYLFIIIPVKYSIGW